MILDFAISCNDHEWIRVFLNCFCVAIIPSLKEGQDLLGLLPGSKGEGSGVGWMGGGNVTDGVYRLYGRLDDEK